MKPLTQLVPDFREAMATSLEEMAEQITDELKADGPYWTGQFESLWVVNSGRKAVRATVPTVFPWVMEAQPRRPTKADVPEQSLKLEGYTIGNTAQYRLYAMDILPGSPTSGRRQGDAPNATAPGGKFWYDNYKNAKMGRTIQRVLTNVFRRYS